MAKLTINDDHELSNFKSPKSIDVLWAFCLKIFSCLHSNLRKN